MISDYTRQAIVTAPPTGWLRLPIQDLRAMLDAANERDYIATQTTIAWEVRLKVALQVIREALQVGDTIRAEKTVRAALSGME